MSNNSKLILGLVGAAAAGAIVALLLAPEKGTEIRKKVSQTASDWAGHLTDLFSNAKGEVDHLKQQGSKAVSDASGKFNHVKESYS